MGDTAVPSVSSIARARVDPFRVLISTMISLRTKDEVTLAASRRLFAEASTPKAMTGLTETRIAELIYPAGFYRTKAHNIRTVCGAILDEHGGTVPNTLEELIAFPGVGRKTANLVLSLGFGKNAICVDTHVHRISNRLGWVATKTPEQTEFALMEILPVDHWIVINELLVSYGQRICTPISPFCSRCTLAEECPRTGVGSRR
jgi:endonuclease-3